MECYAELATLPLQIMTKSWRGLAHWPRALALEENLGSLPSTNMVATVLGDLVPSGFHRHQAHMKCTHTHMQAKDTHTHI